MMKKLALGAFCLSALFPVRSDDKPVLYHLIDRSSEIVVLKVEHAEIGTAITELSTNFLIVGIVQETLQGDLQPEDRVTIAVRVLLRNHDMNPVAVMPKGRYIAFLNPQHYSDSAKVSHYTIQDPPFGFPQLTMTLLSETKRRIEAKTNKASHSSPDRTESK